MMRGGNREMRRMLGKMGLDMNEMEGTASSLNERKR
jgi:NACalpha-BTF3-like transcription factor